MKLMKVSAFLLICSLIAPVSANGVDIFDSGGIIIEFGTPSGNTPTKTAVEEDVLYVDRFGRMNISLLAYNLYGADENVAPSGITVVGDFYDGAGNNITEILLLGKRAESYQSDLALAAGFSMEDGSFLVDVKNFTEPYLDSEGEQATFSFYISPDSVRKLSDEGGVITFRGTVYISVEGKTQQISTLEWSGFVRVR